MRWRKATVGGVMLVALIAAYPALMRSRPEDGATDKVTACDRLAADPLDLERMAPGVGRDQLDISRAEAACSAVLVRMPGDSRTLYQLGRVLFDEGQFQRGLEALLQSAGAGYAQSQFALGTLATKGDHVPQDMCAGGHWWIKAARQRHLYAKIYLAKAWLDDAFSACKFELTPADIGAFITAGESLAATPEEKADLAKVKAEWNAKVGGLAVRRYP
jgi:TPR repeat protein